jgi:hypothetical protein
MAIYKSGQARAAPAAGYELYRETRLNRAAEPATGELIAATEPDARPG